MNTAMEAAFKPLKDEIKTIDRSDYDAGQAAAFLAGLTDEAPRIIHRDILFNLPAKAAIHTDAQETRFKKLQGGSRAMGIVVALALPYIDPTYHGMAPRTVTKTMKLQHFVFSENKSSNSSQSSQVSRIVNTEAKRFSPENHDDNGAVISQAFAFVRMRLAEMGTLDKWCAACPGMSKGGQGKGKSTKAKAETPEPAPNPNPDTPFEPDTMSNQQIGDQLKALIDELAQRSGVSDKGDDNAYDILLAASQRIDDAMNAAI